MEVYRDYIEVYYVEWTESHFQQSWHPEQNYQGETPTMVTIGWLAFSNNRDAIAIASQIRGIEGFSGSFVYGITNIPKSCIVRQRRMKIFFNSEQPEIETVFERTPDNAEPLQ